MGIRLNISLYAHIQPNQQLVAMSTESALLFYAAWRIPKHMCMILGRLYLTHEEYLQIARSLQRQPTAHVPQKLGQSSMPGQATPSILSASMIEGYASMRLDPAFFRLDQPGLPQQYEQS